VLLLDITVQLSYISVQQQLRGVFERVFSEDATTRHYRLDNKSELVLKTLFTNLETRPGMQRVTLHPVGSLPYTSAQNLLDCEAKYSTRPSRENVGE
jgi:hypothetical protein